MTLYDLLEVSPRASKEVIDKAYRVLVKKIHPDFQKSEDKPKAEEIMKKLNHAYEILSDDDKRKRYDESIKLKEGEAPEGAGEDAIVKAFVNWFRGGAK